MNLSVKTVNEVIRLADELQRVYGRSNKTLTFAARDFEDMAKYLASEERKNLFNYINKLSNQEKYELAALAWIGRGDATADQWRTLVKNAQAQKTEDTANYLISKALLAQYLRDGMAKIGNRLAS